MAIGFKPRSQRRARKALTHPQVDTTLALMLGRLRIRAPFGIVRESPTCFARPAAAVPLTKRDLQVFRIAAVFVIYVPDIPQIRDLFSTQKR
jgi:hypothetical protein